MVQQGFQIGLCDDVSKALKIIPTETYNNAFIGVSDEKIECFLNAAIIEFLF